MRRIIRHGAVWLSVLTSMQQQSALYAQTLPVPAPRMHIVAVEGEAAIHNVRQRKPVNIVVIVRDGNRNPVPGASVSFRLPEQGAGAAFADGGKTLNVTTDKDGYAIARGVQPNSTPGPFQIEVEAKRADESATLSVPQFNMTVTNKGGSSGKWVAILLAVGGAAAGGAVAATRGGSTPGTAAPTPVGITAGTGTVGPPR